eukprot:jgi/Chrzof1/5438/Cz16g03030.t1
MQGQICARDSCTTPYFQSQVSQAADGGQSVLQQQQQQQQQQHNSCQSVGKQAHIAADFVTEPKWHKQLFTGCTLC